MGSTTGNGTQHQYQACDGQWCDRFICRVYREGYDDGRRRGYDEGYATGYTRGYEDGYSKGYDAGYAQGFRDGIDACPRPHGKG
jgi:hypothetical protein